MWLGEQITEKGIGNGISLIIFSGIVVGIPGALVKSFQLIKLGEMSLFIALALVILMVAVLIGVVFMERAQRRIPIQYAKRQVGRKMYGGQSTHLPLRVNTAGVIPPIFASSLLLFPATMANFDIADWLKTAASWFTPSSILYNVIFIALILWLFSFSTFIGILFYARSNVAYLFGNRWCYQTAYKVLALIMLFIGGLEQYTVVWDLGDVGIGLMTLFNIAVLYPMSKEALELLKQYEENKNL